MPAITTVPKEIGAYKGCTMFRQIQMSNRDISIGLGSGVIQVVFDQWLVTSTGDIVDKVNSMCYLVKNVPAIEAADEVLDEEGNVLTPAVEAVAGYNGFDSWKNYNAGATPDGTTLEQIIIGSINNTLMSIPMDVADGHIRMPA